MKIGKLSELVFSKLLLDEMIDETEVNNLMLKEYSKETFGVNYPVLALNRTDNRGNSDKLRYKATPLTYKGRKYYLTGEWFEENKDRLISYVETIIKK